jgi:putative FmdB family regulatory protein
MPTYEYRCRACGHDFEEFQSITADPLTKCPACHRKKLVRLMGTGGGVIFKGSGFYQTDYRSESYKKAAEADKSATSSTSESKSGESKGGMTKAPAPAGEEKPKKSDSAPKAKAS